MSTHNPLQPTETPDLTVDQDYQTLLASFAQTVWETDAQGRVGTDSPTWRAYTGQSLSEWFGEGWTAMIHPGDRNWVLDQWQQALAQHDPLNVEFRLRRSDGSWHWTNLRATPIQLSDGLVKKWLYLTIDINPKKQAEEALRESERFMQGVIRSLPLVIYLFDLVQCRNRYLSPQVAELFGYTPQQMQATNADLVTTFFHPDDWPQLWAHFARIRSNQYEGVSPIEYRINHRQRGWVWVESRDIVYARDAQGNPTLLLGTAEDITQRQAIVQALQESEKRLRLAIEATELATWEWNLETDEVYWNEQHFRLFGMEPKPNPLSPDEFFCHVHPDEQPRIKNLLEQAIAKRCVYDAEFCAVREDGSQRWMSGYGRIVEERDGKPIRLSGVMFDVNERRRAEDALKMADQRKDEFLAMLAHELRNPMSTIRSGLQLLTLTDGKEEASRATIAMMNRQTDHLVRLVDDLLDVSRIGRGKIELKKEPIELVELVRAAAQSIHFLFDEQKRHLLVQLPEFPIYLVGDATRLTQVVINLLTNGARYTEPGGNVWLSLEQEDDRNVPTDTPEWGSHASPTLGREAIIQVRDNGIGLASDKLTSIFELFVQVDNSLARSKGGLGLGLTLVKQLVDMHGGWVEALSEGLGQGSTFRIHLPTLPVAPVTESTSAGSTSHRVAAARLLVVDDNEDAALTLALLLKMKGYEVHTCNSGRSGLEAAQSLQPAAILLDISMPEMDGYETCRLLRQQSWGVGMRLIALTGYGQAEDRQRTKEVGFDGHLVKPVDLEALTKLLTNLLEKNQSNYSS